MTAPALTPEQEAAVENIAKRRVRRYSRAATAGFVILALGIGGTIYTRAQDGAARREAIVTSGRVVSVDGCNRDFKSIMKLRGIIAASRTSLQAYHKDGVINDIQYRRGLRDIERQLASYPLPDCRKAAAIVTDNPAQQRKIATPLYPKADRANPGG